MVYEVTFLAMEANFLIGNKDAALVHFESIRNHATDDAVLQAVGTRMNILINEAQYEQALELGMSCVAQLAVSDLVVPRHPNQDQLRALHEEVS